MKSGGGSKAEDARYRTRELRARFVKAVEAGDGESVPENDISHARYRSREIYFHPQSRRSAGKKVAFVVATRRSKRYPSMIINDTRLIGCESEVFMN